MSLRKEAEAKLAENLKNNQIIAITKALENIDRAKKTIKASEERIKNNEEDITKIESITSISELHNFSESMRYRGE